MSRKTLSIIAALLLAETMSGLCQQSPAAQNSVPIIQPGRPGQTNKTLTPESAAGSQRKPSEADIKFMQGMIMHHGQAVEMTELLRTRSHDEQVQALGRRISISQTDEMRYMKQWLTDRGLPLASGHDHPMNMDGMSHDHMAGMDMGSMPMMPGMLTSQQMDALAKASGPEFDHLFLTGMIQHHTGALTMVKELFQSPGAGQDPQLFDFASDVDNTQQAEIDIMKHLLKEKQ